MKPSGIGGQAVMEGVMMKNKDTYAVAVRKADNKIVVDKQVYTSFSEKHPIFKLPILRGILAFIESMIIGMKTLTFSAGFFEEEEEVKPTKMEHALNKVFKDKAESIFMGITIVAAVALAIGIFMILPFFVADLLESRINNNAILALIEGLIRISIFVIYIVLISQMQDIKRVFMYHGAEHKTINCLEQGFELTLDNVKWQSREHKRCGTSFMLLVMLISVIFFIFIRVDTLWLRVIVRLLLVPVIAGVSYEFIRLAGRSESPIVNLISKPGMLLQRLTTREPDDSMIEVAICSVEEVFDWREYLETEFNKETLQKQMKEKANGLKNTDRDAKEFTAVTEEQEEDAILLALDRYFVMKEVDQENEEEEWPH